MSKTIWIDPGHGGKDAGAVALGRQEKADNLRYALELARQFEAQGMKTVLTRTGDSYPTYTERCAKEAGCDLAICCHRNAASTDSAQGAEIWLHHAAQPAVVAWASDTIKRLQAAGMPARTGTAAKGVYKGFRTDPNADYYCNSGTKSPSMLLELGFVSSTGDNARFDKDYKKYCTAIVQAACAYLGVPYKAPAGGTTGSGTTGNTGSTGTAGGSAGSTGSNGIYRVQVGAFSQEENARRQAQELQQKGYQTIVKQD